MTPRQWKRVQPSTLRDALKLCQQHGRERHNLSIERIAALMGLEDHWALYKWVANGRMPAVLVPAFEAACGINLVSRWLAASAGKVLIEVPTGRAATAHDTQRLQEILTETTGTLLAFYAGKNDAQDTLAALQNAMEELAWHRGNVQQHGQPQLELGDQA
jgi:phosphate/sulfate permease